MFLVRRLVWFTTGATAGFGGAMWIRRRLLRKFHELVPRRVSSGAARSLRGGGNALREAVSEGRIAFRRREAELRAELRPGGGPALGRAAIHQGPGVGRR